MLSGFQKGSHAMLFYNLIDRKPVAKQNIMFHSLKRYRELNFVDLLYIVYKNNYFWIWDNV